LFSIVGVELARLSVVGPSLDVRLDNAYGIIEFMLTRGVHGLLVGLPMAFGVVAGVQLARRREGRGVRRRRPIGTALLGALVVGLAILVAWPASTPALVGRDGRPTPGSIAELSTVRLGGADKPVLLYLAGGPGQSDLALTRVEITGGWERDFVFVDFDQRGTGKSYAAIDPASSMTVDRAVADVIELTEYLRDRFDEEKVYLMGESWGTILGVLAIKERPDLYYAWIPSGQMVDVLETDQRVYADLVAYAGSSGNADLAAKLRDVGPPPYADFPWANSNLLAWYEYLYKPYTPSSGYIARGEAGGLDPFGMFGSEYNLIEKTTVLRGLIDAFTLLYPQLYDIDLRERAASLDVPVYMLDGAAELDGRRALALEWFQALDAPSKQLITYEDAAHAVAFEQADAVQQELVGTVVPATYQP
jgi:proline iminopeptidase